MSDLSFTRRFAMPSSDTFSVRPIADFVAPYLIASGVSIDPFARNTTMATWRNDINPATSAPFHMDAAEFCAMLGERGVRADLALFDPPYSPRQISECYNGFGREVSTRDTQNAALYKRVRDALDPLMLPGAVVLSFGWNSAGMGKTRGYEQIEIVMVAHGGAHNDTICVAERKATP